MRNLLLLSLALILASSCSSNSTQKQELISATVEELVASPVNFQEKEVAVSGMLTHVCRHGGQKCFIVGEDGDTQVRIVPGSGIDEFSIDLEGSTVAFKGTFRVMTTLEHEEHEQDHDSKEHHAIEMSHSKAEKADIFLEATELKELTD